MYDATGAVLHRLSRLLALAGGLVLVALIALTATSIAGRGLIAFGLDAVPGDFELVEAGAAFAVFSFMPWCQLNRGHMTVDIFAGLFGRRLNAAIDLASALLLTAVTGLLAWRHMLGMLDRRAYEEVSFILQLPLWWFYAASLAGLVLFVATSLFSVWQAARALPAAFGAAR
ncbi:MAG: TRAP transporter small permease [Pseudomonadota bacterium]|nr:TRAP transporter small permease [Pseudomonadota bacterium]